MIKQSSIINLDICQKFAFMKFLKEYYLFFISLFLTITIGSLFFYQNSKEFFPDNQIQIIAKSYADAFSNTTSLLEENIVSIQSQIDSADFIKLNNEDKVKFLSNNISQYEVMKGLMVLEHNGRFSILQKDQSTYVFASDSSSKIDNITWYRIDGDQNIINSWTMALGLELNVLKWGEDVFNQSYEYSTALWSSSSHLFGSNSINIVIHYTWKSPNNNQLITVIAFIDNNSIGHRIPKVFEDNFQSFLVNLSGRTIPLQGGNLIKSDSVKNKTLYEKAVQSWEITGRKVPGTYNFLYLGDTWWGQSVVHESKGVTGIVLNVNESALYIASFGDHWIEILLIVLLVILTVYLFFRRRRKIHLSLEEFIKSQNTDKHASELIKLGENDHLEFKSSFRYDYQLSVVNKELEGVIAKSIAAFANGRGGTLLIGVDDEGNILGLEKDINTLKRKDLDFFENVLRTFLNKSFTVSFVTQYLEIKFPVLDQKVICRINIVPSTEPVFIEIAKNSQKSERFYLRSGNTSQEITSLREINDYVKGRFSN